MIKIIHKNKKPFSHFETFKLIYLFLVIQVLILFYFGFAFSDSLDWNTSDKTQSHITKLYPFFQDIHVMVFVGFGFLMTFLKSHSWSSASFNFLIGAFSMEMGLICLHIWESVFEKKFLNMQIDITLLIRADFVAATVLITYGAVIGKFTMVQYLVMAYIEIIFITLNSVLGEKILKVTDIGGSMYIHMFGAYFGLALIQGYKMKDFHNNPKNGSDYNSNIFAMIGTLFLFMFWPSFNGALAFGNAQRRAIVNTTLSISSSVMSVFLISPFFRKGKLFMDNILNSTLAGGVVIGVSCDFIPNPSIAIVIGFFAGVVSSIGFEYIAPFLKKNINFQDTAGIHNLHAMPGFFGSIIAVIIIASDTMTGLNNKIGEHFTHLDIKRSSGTQAGYQALVILITLGISLSSGYLTGLLLKLDFFAKTPDLFCDRNFFDMEEEGEEEIQKQITRLLTLKEINSKKALSSEKTVERYENTENNLDDQDQEIKSLDNKQASLK